MTGALQRLGVELGDDLLPANKDNVRGFWENRMAMEINEDLLMALSLRWDAVVDLPAGWTDTPAAHAAYGKAVSLLDAKFSDAPLWAIKDPRMCRLAPPWLKAARTLGAQPVVVMIVRKPSEVVASLGERDGMPAGLASLLWLRHLIDAEFHSRGVPRVIVTYDQLLSDWRGVFDHIADALKITWPKRDEEADAEIDSFLTRTERHHHHVSGALDLELAEDAYALCCQLADADETTTWADFERIAAEFRAAWRVLGQPLIDMHVAVDRERASRRAEQQEWEQRKQQDLQFFQSHIEKLNGENRELGSRLLNIAATSAERDSQAAQLSASLGVISENLSSLLGVVADPQRVERLAAQIDDGKRMQIQLDARITELADGLAELRAEEGLLQARMQIHEDRVEGIDEGLRAFTDQERRLLDRGWIIRGLLGTSGRNSKSRDRK